VRATTVELPTVSTTRNDTLDALKGIGVLFVVLGHNWIVSEKGELFRIIFSFHMPLFFFVAGVLLRTDLSFGLFLYSRAQSLLKPFFATLLIVAAATTVARLAGAQGVGDTSWLRLLFWLYGTGPVMPWNLTPLWFLPHLFLALMLSFLLLRNSDSDDYRYSWALTLLMLWLGAATVDFAWRGLEVGGFAVAPNLGLPWSLDLLLVSTPFVIAGYLLRQRVAKFQITGSGFALAVLLFGAMHCAFDETIDLNLRSYGSTLVASAQAFAGVYICLCLARLAQRRKWVARTLAYLGSASLFIFMFHYYVHNVAMWRLPRHLESMQTCAAIAFVLSVVVPVAMFEVTRRVGVLRTFFLPDQWKEVTSKLAEPAGGAPESSHPG